MKKYAVILSKNFIWFLQGKDLSDLHFVAAYFTVALQKWRNRNRYWRRKNAALPVVTDLLYTKHITELLKEPSAIEQSVKLQYNST